MNSVKNILVITVLLGVGYAVYTTINNQQGTTRPAEENDGWPTPGDAKAEKAPGEGDAKPAAVKNPFGSGNPAAVKNPFGSGNPAAERVSARDTNPFGYSPGSTERSRSEPGRSDRFGTTSPEGGAKAADPPSDLGPRSGNTLGRWEGPSSEPPGIAMTTDLPTHPASGRTTDPGPQEPSVKQPDAPDASRGAVRPDFIAVMDEAHRRLAKGQLAEVHLALSRLYGNPELNPEESRQLTDLLGQLAGTVIYSRQHLLEPAYTVKAGETLQQIAATYNVPWQVLAKINGIRDPDHPEPGKQLKVFHGPFEAVVSLDREELVLMLGGRYAGRFPIGVGRNAPKPEGSYTVKRKLPRPPYSGSGRALEPRGADSLAGNCWIELSDGLGIHGTNDVKNLRSAEGQGAICLGPRDIEDVYDLLTADSQSSPGSKVTIRR